MKNEAIYRAALNAAWEAGEKSRVENGRYEWEDEDFEVAAAEFKKRLLDEDETNGL